ncbi:hypothetical protein DYST_03163 [Dyella terrae]|nr:hypothetical protein DYST_03163 [Dyella terrae]
MWCRWRGAAMRRVRVRGTDLFVLAFSPGLRAFAPSPFRGEGWGEGSTSPHAFIFSRHPGVPHKRGQGPGSSFCIAWLSRNRDLARRQRAFALLPEAESLSLACPRESNQREGHPHLALAGCAGQYVRGRRAFRQGLLPWRKGIGIHADPPCGPSRPPLTAAQGPEGQRRKQTARAAELHIALAGRGNARGDNHTHGYWIPAFAGMTAKIKRRG